MPTLPTRKGENLEGTETKQAENWLAMPIKPLQILQ
jgi:hypothetical protein